MQQQDQSLARGIRVTSPTLFTLITVPDTSVTLLQVGEVYDWFLFIRKYLMLVIIMSGTAFGYCTRNLPALLSSLSNSLIIMNDGT